MSNASGIIQNCVHNRRTLNTTDPCAMVIHFLPGAKRQENVKDLKKNGVLERKQGRNKVCAVPSPRSSNFFLRSEDVINRTEAGMT